MTNRIPILSLGKLKEAALIIALLLLAFSSEKMYSQNVGKISGIITDLQTGEALIGCNIVVQGTKLGASSDVDGSYFILNVPPGKYNIEATMIGYQKVIQRNVIVNAGRTTTAAFKLQSSAVELGAVVVEATRPDVEREKTSTSAIIRTDEVQNLAGMRDVSDVLGLAADVTDGHFRGGRDGEELYTLQGMGIVNPLNSSSAFMPIMSAVEEVEVVTSGFGAQYGNAQSGVVNITMKEGKPDKWRAAAEVRSRLPQRKHFGPSIYDQYANPSLTRLATDIQMWLTADPATNNTGLFRSFGLNNIFGGDTLAQLAAARTIWLLQTKRDMNMNYGTEIDYSAEGSAGGPLADGLRMFLAFRSDVNHPVFPTQEPDKQRQIMGNIVADLGEGAVLRLSGGYSNEASNVFPSASGLGFYTWQWDRILSINYRRNENIQLGARFSKALSHSTYYDIKFNTLSTNNRVGSSPAPSWIADSLIYPVPRIDWDKVLIGPASQLGNYLYMRGDDQFRNEKTRTYSLEASMTSQVTNSHLLNGGIQFNYYTIDVRNAQSTQSGSGGAVSVYSAKPFELGTYIQDKMEFEGMIANVGLRLDVWSSQLDYYTNLFSPFKLVQDTVNKSVKYDAGQASKAKTPMIARLQPRVGVSFPVTVTTVFHANYGSFMQRPSFQYIVSTQVTQGSNIPRVLGNPRLEPQVTNSYDLGIMQGLGEGLTLDVSGYYKDIKNLVEAATFTSRNGLTYQSYFNRDNADVRGFRIALSKRRGSFTGTVNYQYSIATGKSATADYAPPAFIEDSLGNVTTNNDKVPLRDVPLGFDRTHNLVINLAYVTDEEFGPEILGGYPLSGWVISASSFLRSGRPYTSPGNPKLINGSRTPAEYNTNLRLTKRIRNFFGVPASIYFEVFNVFDNKILNYSYLFSTPNAMTTSTVTQLYEQYSLDDPRGVRYWNATNEATPEYPVDQSFLIYSNSPRSFTFGLSLEL